MFIDSKRIAPFGLYTNREDIPRYQTSNRRQMMNHANIIDGRNALASDDSNDEGNAINHAISNTFDFFRDLSFGNINRNQRGESG